MCIIILNKFAADKFNRDESEISKLKGVISQLEREISNIVTAIMKGISSPTLEEKLQSLEQTKKDTVYELNCAKNDQFASLYTPEEIKSNLNGFKKVLQKGNIGECKPIVKQFISKITIAENDKITFSYCLDTIGADEGT